MLVKTNAIVISTVKYGDSSLITRCYCKELGLKSFMLKGILTSKKGGLKKSLFQPLNLINISTQIKNQSNQKLNFIREGSLKVHFKEIPLKIKKNAIALFISEVIFFKASIVFFLIIGIALPFKKYSPIIGR